MPNGSTPSCLTSCREAKSSVQALRLMEAAAARSAGAAPKLVANTGGSSMVPAACAVSDCGAAAAAGKSTAGCGAAANKSAKPSSKLAGSPLASGAGPGAAAAAAPVAVSTTVRSTLGNPRLSWLDMQPPILRAAQAGQGCRGRAAAAVVAVGWSRSDQPQARLPPTLRLPAACRHSGACLSSASLLSWSNADNHL